MTQAEVLQAVVTRTRQTWPEVERVLLFGSRARGDARPDSDYDLLLIVPEAADGARARVLQTARLRLALRGLNASFDLVVLTPAEFAAMATSGAWWSRSVLEEARVLHEAA